MFSKILIANRGEIALRVIRAAKELGIKTVAVYSEADRDSLHVQYADEAYCIGPGPSSRSYLNVPNIISAACISGADAIHPGYGFLAEDPSFAEICESHGLRFVGPPSEVLEKAGDKASARLTMKKAGIPVIPGTDGPISSEGEALEFARKIGFPVLIKAAAGGGGRGIRVVRNEEELAAAVGIARAEAEAAFGSPAVYLEKFIRNPRHVEVQIVADASGNVIALGERDCSIQRRYQKIVEESPSPAVDRRLRERMLECAVECARACGYRNAGTVEFLLDGEGNFYFMEVNARIQVEHPVTEFVTGIDLVKLQLAIASGEELPYRQSDVTLSGHAIECRINAEDPARNFAPCAGTIKFYHAPGGPGIRVDSFAYSGCSVPQFYDSLVAKVIAWGRDRDEAIARMGRALEELLFEGITTNTEFLQALIATEAFRKGTIHTDDDVVSLVFGRDGG